MQPTENNRPCGSLKALGKLRGERVVAALATAAVLAGAVSILRRDSIEHRGMTPEVYWVVKHRWQGAADMVIAGDSRTFSAVSPSHMQELLPNMRILNYGFSGVAYSDTYLTAVQRVLDPGSERKTLLLGITPRSLTEGARRNNRFLEYSNKTPQEKLVLEHLSGFAWAFRPILPRGALATLRLRSLDFRGYRHWYPDGWVASRDTPDHPAAALRSHTQLFAPHRGGPVSDRLVGQLMRRIAEWHRAGIVVYGFAPPSCPEMASLEEKLAGFDEQAFRAQFNAAGGTWLSVDPSPYRAFDGNHLPEDQAIRLSRELAQWIRERQTAQGRPSG